MVLYMVSGAKNPFNGNIYHQLSIIVCADGILTQRELK